GCPAGALKWVPQKCLHVAPLRIIRVPHGATRPCTQAGRGQGVVARSAWASRTCRSDVHRFKSCSAHSIQVLCRTQVSVPAGGRPLGLETLESAEVFRRKGSGACPVATASPRTVSTSRAARPS